MRAKNFRNMWRRNGITKCQSDCQPWLDLVSGQRNIVEEGLLTALNDLGTKYTSLASTAHRKHCDAEKHALEQEKKVFDAGLASRREAVEKSLADLEKKMRDGIAKDRASLDRERENYEEHIKSATADLDTRKTDLEQGESALQNTSQFHCALGKVIEEFNFVKMSMFGMVVEQRTTAGHDKQQSQVNHSRVVELQRELETKTVELERLQDKERSRENCSDLSHSAFYTILSLHQRSQEQQKLSSLAREEEKDDGGNLAGMLRTLPTSHAQAVTEAKIAKHRQRAFQQENEILEQRLANAEAQISTDRLIFRSAISRMDSCAG